MYYCLSNECRQSKNFNNIEEAFESKELQSCKTSPIMEGYVKEDEMD